jgi:thiamine biosynthesis protein ThiS
MTITLNGAPRELPGPLTVAELLRLLGYAGQAVAVARNQTFVPRSAHATTTLAAGDDVEIVAPMPGG